MKTTAKTDIVNYLLGLFATAVLLVAWPRGKKGCKGVKWSQVTAQDMMDPAYLDELAEGNIGVILGPASGGIASIDIDDDQGAEEFLGRVSPRILVFHVFLTYRRRRWSQA